MSRPALLMYCQHSLGLGHLMRSFELAKSLSKQWRVVMLSGGTVPAEVAAPSEIEIIELPPLKATIDWRIIGVDGEEATAQTKKRRRRLILDALQSVKPQVLVVELFPFGRKKFRDELLPLLDAANHRGVLVACSLRDILVGRGSEQHDHDDRACELANRYFDIVLVHSDPRFARFEESFHPRESKLKVPVHHTGFIVPPNEHAKEPVLAGRRPLIVSAGGGVVGERLLRPALEAHRKLWRHHRIPTLMVAGPFLPDDAWRRLSRRAGGTEGVELLRHVPDLNAWFGAAGASISQCGYNTAMAVIRARVPALVVPFSEQDEDEQTNRARRLERLGLVLRLDAEDVERGALEPTIPRLLKFRPAPVRLDLDGGETSTALLSALVR